MAKTKSKGAVKKRFRITKSGKVKCSRPARGHMHASGNGKRRRRLRSPLILPPEVGRAIKAMLGA